MYNNVFFDRFISFLIVFFSYTLVFFIWYNFFANFELQKTFLLLFFPHGIIVLSFLFFNNKIIFSLLASQIIIYLILQSYNLELPFNNYFILSLCQLVSMPITLFVLQKFSLTVGVGKNFKLDKTNIYHVLLITFISTIVLGTFIILSSIFFENHINLLSFVTGNFLGGVILILGMKLVVNLPTLIKRFFQTN